MLTIASAFFLLQQPQTVYGAGYVVNWNVDFNTQAYWGEMLNQWNGQTTNYWGDAWVTSDGIAHTKVSVYGGAWYNPAWANCWLGQGDTLWGSCGGYTFTPVPCTSAQWLVGRSRLDTQYASWNGLTCTFLNLWGTFSSPTGSKGYTKFEIVIYLSRSASLGFWNGRTATLTVDNEGSSGNRYVVQHRITSDIKSSFTDYHVDVTALFTAMKNAFGVNLALGKTTGLNVGNEACNGGSESSHDYLYYYVG